MDVLKAMEARRSMRAYDPSRPVDHQALEELIRTAGLAPSWKNSQTARCYVAESPELVAELRKTCLPEFNRKNSAGAPVLIVTAFVRSHSGFDREGNAENEVGEGWGAYDLGLHDAHLILRAKELGLDTLIMGIRNAGRLRALLHIPEDQEIVSVIAVGYGAAEPPMPPRKPVDQTAVFF